ncbi:unnamed protein product [Vitrella brassicaformis CCMP3155]|uniref:EF-hand domain-containing protein n=2 Tax=Vitrella brassicaformis TaxID=1169539 RepID=A0A0G4FQW7_VITBC|nr:unnamed protein product [Vitrella brassicaformis CCMP3155]|eukprot:CEM16616.1 unnamed protein product [Vitrella brassicaformis CCMP3155]
MTKTSPAEVRELIVKIQQKEGLSGTLNDHYFAKVFKLLDPDGNNSVDKSEFFGQFNKFWKHRRRYLTGEEGGTMNPAPAAGPAETDALTESDLKALWNAYSGGDEKMDHGEVRKLVDRIREKEGIPGTLQDVYYKKIFKMLDPDNSGFVDWSEFKANFNRFWRHKKRYLSEGELRALWDHYDKDKSGALSRTELRVLLEKIRYRDGEREALSDSFLNEVFRMLDPDNSGEITWEEFSTRFNDFWTRRKRRSGADGVSAATSAPKLTDEELRTLWDHYDTDGSGYLDRNEIRVLLEKIRIRDGVPDPLPEPFVQMVFQELDPDGSNRIDFDEFRAKFNDFWVRRSGRFMAATRPSATELRVRQARIMIGVPLSLEALRLDERAAGVRQSLESCPGLFWGPNAPPWKGPLPW